MTKEPEYLTSAQVATILKLKENTLAKWRMLKKGLDYVKMEGKIYYTRETVEKYQQQSTVKVGVTENAD